MMKKEADEMAYKVEEKQDFRLLSKSNAYKKSLKTKSEESPDFDKELPALKEKLTKLK